MSISETLKRKFSWHELKKLKNTPEYKEQWEYATNGLISYREFEDWCWTQLAIKKWLKASAVDRDLAFAVECITTEDEARQQAIDFQTWSSEQSLSYSELIQWQEYFIALAKKFDLTDEFKENGIL